MGGKSKSASHMNIIAYFYGISFNTMLIQKHKGNS